MEVPLRAKKRLGQVEPSSDYVYDALNRLTLAAFPVESGNAYYPISAAYRYDANDNELSVIETKHAPGGASLSDVTTAEYDALNRQTLSVQRGEPVQCLVLQPQHFAHLARRRAAAIGDDVGRHGRAERAVLGVNVLNGALALIAGGEVEIDVGPLAALLGEEAFEE